MFPDLHGFIRTKFTEITDKHDMRTKREALAYATLVKEWLCRIYVGIGWYTVRGIRMCVYMVLIFQYGSLTPLKDSNNTSKGD